MASALHIWLRASFEAEKSEPSSYLKCFFCVVYIHKKENDILSRTVGHHFGNNAMA